MGLWCWVPFETKPCNVKIFETPINQTTSWVSKLLEGRWLLFCSMSSFLNYPLVSLQTTVSVHLCTPSHSCRMGQGDALPAVIDKGLNSMSTNGPYNANHCKYLFVLFTEGHFFLQCFLRSLNIYTKNSSFSKRKRKKKPNKQRKKTPSA